MLGTLLFLYVILGIFVVAIILSHFQVEIEYGAKFKELLTYLHVIIMVIFLPISLPILVIFGIIYGIKSIFLPICVKLSQKKVFKSY